MAKKYIIDLTEDEKNQLIELTQKGETKARKLKRANIILLANDGYTDCQIAKMLRTSKSTVERTRKRFVEGNVERALNEDPRSGRPVEFDGKAEAFLVALACSDPPAGQKCWTMYLLAEKLVELKVVDAISDETVRLRLKKTKPSRGNASSGVYPN